MKSVSRNKHGFAFEYKLLRPKGYDHGEWATYAQWQERKAQVRKGEKATTVVFWKLANSAS